ncbi:DUF4386 domain-containing protein [Sulfurimonas sp. HSL-3221]|uniref:DUF4386 domain-containing protein n=1 Tax=Sulfurimonadaceae TaxID=2771471 RepID=UPI001E2A3E80|nr:DUF4386 domain-containing protein [Sulfurimonas sp. HSL-3221]UFS63265.1 DUF4386 domain-containing protein [Sulfurimonas sp. HSL-3221]
MENEKALNGFARLAGAAWLVVILTGITAEFFLRMPLIVPGDAAATATNILGAEGLFRLSIAADIVMLLFDVTAAVALYLLFSPVNRLLALLATAFRLLMGAVLAANLTALTSLLSILHGTDAAPPSIVQQLLDTHASGYAIGLVFFGLHCFILGGLIVKSRYLPRLLGGLLMVASLGYLIDSFAQLLLPQGAPFLAVTAEALIALALLAELSLSLWLLAKGVRA